MITYIPKDKDGNLQYGVSLKEFKDKDKASKAVEFAVSNDVEIMRLKIGGYKVTIRNYNRFLTVQWL